MNWDIKEIHNYNEYMQKYSIHSLLAKIFAQREYNEQDVQGHTSKRLIYHDFSLFLDADLVLDRIQEALENDEKICIYGDYDCDGILSTAILVQAFLELGKKVGYHIPNRFEDGYGLNKERVQQMYEKGYSLLITVDNGIKAYEAIDLANELGIDVIVIDHHDYDELPDACAIIHTKMSPDYPFKEICGGFLAYKLASSLLGKHDKYLFSLAAITTISDMMPLVDENKSLVSRGLQFMNEEKYLQLELLIGENQKYNTTTLGFNIAPKINSFGRLPELVNPNHLVRYFLKDVDQKFAIQISQYAKKINSKRQSLTNEQYKNILENSQKDEFLYSYNQEVHEGIVGLIAGKYTHEFQKPSFVMKYDEKNEVYRGSARSIESIPLNQIFDDLKDYFVQYGGHALAGKLRRRTNGILARELRGEGTGSGRVDRAFLGGVTHRGEICRFDTVEALCPRIYAIIDSAGLGNEMLETVVQAAQAKHFDIIACPNPDRPRELHHVLIPEKGLAFITTNARNPYDGKPYRRLRLDAMAEEKLTRAQKAKLRFTHRVEASLLDEAVSALSDAKKAHDALESAYHPCVDFEGATALAEKEIKRLLKQ